LRFGFKVWGLEFGFEVWGFEFGFEVWGFEFGFEVWGFEFGFEVWGFECGAPRLPPAIRERTNASFESIQGVAGMFQHGRF
jgi:hypothetical protein